MNYRKIKFSAREVAVIDEEGEGFVWVCLDARRGMLVAGLNYLADMRDFLMTKRSRVEDIYALGLNLRTGEINFPRLVNGRNPVVREKREISAEIKDRIETLVHYFFADADGFKRQAALPRYTKNPALLGRALN